MKKIWLRRLKMFPDMQDNVSSKRYHLIIIGNIMSRRSCDRLILTIWFNIHITRNLCIELRPWSLKSTSMLVMLISETLIRNQCYFIILSYYISMPQCNTMVYPVSAIEIQQLVPSISCYDNVYTIKTSNSTTNSSKNIN